MGANVQPYSTPIVEDGFEVEVKHKITNILSGHISTIDFLLYFAPNTIVSCSLDSQIRIWQKHPPRLIKVIDEHKNRVYHLLKFSDQLFFSCGEDCCVRSFSIHSPYEKRSELRFQYPILQMLKLTSDLICVLLSSREIQIISHTENKVVKKLIPQFTQWNSRMVFSNIHKFSFYLSTSLSGGEGSVLLINYFQNRVIKKFNDHKREINAMTLFNYSYLEEIIIVGGNVKREGNDVNFVFLYNTDSGKCFMKIPIPDAIHSMLLINKKYLVCGLLSGFIDVVFLKNMSFHHKLYSSRIHQNSNSHDSAITDMKLVEIEYQKEVKIVSCSADKEIKIFNISGLYLTNLGDESEDLKERIYFTRSHHEEFLFELLEKNMVFCDLNFRNLKIQGIFKSFLSGK